MRKDGLIVCLLIALGFAIDCTQANISVADASSEQLASTTPTATSSVIASTPAASLIDGYRDFKFGMTVSELVAVKGACKSFDDTQASEGTVFGDACYEMNGEKRDLKFRVSSPPGSSENEAREKVLDLIVVEVGPYDKGEYLKRLDNSLSKKYRKTVRMSKRDIQQVKDGSKYRTGNLYAKDQVALVLQKNDEGKMSLVMYYCTPELARTLHSDLKKPK